jgi:hypothetical protein
MAPRDNPVRNVVAYAARSARRVIALAHPDEQALCFINISFADSVAAGEPPGYARALRTNVLSRISPEQTTGSHAGQTAMLAGRAALILSVLIDRLFDRPAPSDPDITAIFEYLDRASSEARAAVAQSGWSDNIGKLEAAFRHDDQVLSRLTSVDGQYWLGLPVDAGENGPFGTLWPDGEPDWYVRLGSGIVPKIVAGDASEEMDTADVVCWYLEPDAGDQGGELEEIKSFVQSKNADNNRYGRAPQIFVVHANGLSDKHMAELVMAGATVLADDQLIDLVPRSSTELVIALRRHIARGYRGWNLDGGLWQYFEGYHDGAAPPDFASIYVDDDLERVQGASDQRPYQSLIEASKSLVERLETELGWPIEI